MNDDIMVGFWEEKRRCIEYASEMRDIPYLNMDVAIVDKNRVFNLTDNVNREEAIGELAKVTKDIEMAIRIEAGLFEFILCKASNEDINYGIMPSMYRSQLDEILLNIDPNAYLKNHGLIRKLKTINPQEVAFMTPHQMHEESWQEYVDRMKIREDKKNNKATTDLYECYKCGERKCQMVQLQTRSADEPMTKFITCQVCYHVFKQ